MGEPKYELLKADIKKRILEKSWLPGEKIPSQRKLEELFSVSRITVKKAISDLINENYLEHIDGKKGLFIRDRSFEALNRTIAVAIDDVTDRFGSILLRGIEDYLWERKYHTIICNADRDFDKVEAYFHSFDFQKVDGIIFAPVIDTGYSERNRLIIDVLKEKNLPHVLLDRFIPEVQSNYVISNHRESARQVVDHLIKSGHRRILIGSGLECTGVIMRIEGVKQAYRENGIEPPEELFVKVNDNKLYPEMDPGEVEKMKDQIARAGDFTAFYALNNRLLNAGIRSMLDMGRQVEGLNLALHNEISKPFPPYTDDITRVVPPLYKMGWTAAKILLERIKEGDDSISQITLRSDIVFENSAAVEK